MLNSSIPTKFSVPFANSATATYKRAVPVTTADPNAASQTLGFPPNTFLPISSGGAAPDGRDFNGLLNQLSAWAQWQAAGGVPQYDAAFSTAIGGYPAGCILASAAIVGYFWLNLVDNNTTNPDAGGANWQAFSLQGPSTGDLKLTFKTVADPGWILMDDGSIGSSTSGASNLANAIAQPLFTLLYNNFVDSWAPVQTSVGGATTRAAQGTAAAAWAANCRLVLPRALGRVIGVAGNGAGLTARALGQFLGEETHTMTSAELAAHIHNFVGSLMPNITVTTPNLPTAFRSQGAGGGAQSVIDGFGTLPSNPISPGTPAGAITSTGSATPFNVMQPTSFWNVMVKL